MIIKNNHATSVSFSLTLIQPPLNIMLHFIIIYLTTTLFIIAGGMSAVSEEDEKQITTDSDLIFEAIFVEKQIQHYLDGKKIDSIDLNNLDGKYNDLIDGISVRRKITLLITKPIKGNL